MVLKYIDICYICKNEKNNSKFVYKCPICEKYICEYCAELVENNEIHNLYVCKDCVKDVDSYLKKLRYDFVDELILTYGSQSYAYDIIK